MKLVPRRGMTTLKAAAVIALSILPCLAHAQQQFLLKSGNNGLTGTGSGRVLSGGFALSLTAGPAGALFDEMDSRGLGVDSSGIANAFDFASDRFHILQSADPGNPSPLAGLSEWVDFSFDRDGVIRDLLFDGVKDETLEYMILTTSGGKQYSFFDAEVVLRLENAGWTAAWLTAPNVTLLTSGNDDVLNVDIPFAAGETFRMSYGEFPFPPGYIPASNPNDLPNGARWEGIVVLPEPPAGLLASIAAGGAACRWRGRRKNCA